MLSVIVPATDSPPTLARCVRAVEDSMPEAAELIVQTEPAGSGPAAARNRAARRARGEVLVFVDSDVVVHADALRGIAARFARGPQVTAVFGSYDQSPQAPGVVSRFRNLLHHHVHTSSPGPAETFWAGLGAVRRDAFERAGGFDAGRFPVAAIEDIELGARLRELGGRIELDPAIRGTHLKAWTLRSMIATDFARRGVPWTRLQLERRSPARSLNMAPRQRLAVGAAAAAALAAVAGRPRIAAASIAGMVAANAPLYALLARTGGLRLAAAGVPLHAVHHLTAMAAVVAGAVAHAAVGPTRRVTR